MNALNTQKKNILAIFLRLLCLPRLMNLLDQWKAIRTIALTTPSQLRPRPDGTAKSRLTFISDKI